MAVDAITAIGFDADDTLWQNETYFRMTEQRFAALLAEHGDIEAIGARLLDAERRNLGFYGYGVKGFNLSMIETAVEVTRGQVSAAVIADILSFGREMLQNPVETLPNVPDTLTALPAAMAILGPRVNMLKVRRGDLAPKDTGAWATISRWVMRLPVTVIIVTVTGLLIMAMPAFSAAFAAVDYL